MKRFRVLCLAALVAVAMAILGPSPPVVAGETETTVKKNPTDCTPTTTNTPGVYTVSNFDAVHEKLGASDSGVSKPGAVQGHSMLLASYFKRPYDPLTDKYVAWVKTRDGWRLIERRDGDWPFMLTRWPIAAERDIGGATQGSIADPLRR